MLLKPFHVKTHFVRETTIQTSADEDLCMQKRTLTIWMANDKFARIHCEFIEQCRSLWVKMANYSVSPGTRSGWHPSD